MKTLVILFASSRSLHIFDKAFAGKSAFEKSLEWADSVKKINESETVVFADSSIEKQTWSAVQSLKSESDIEFVFEENWTVQKLFESFSKKAQEKSAVDILFAWADQPFINLEITRTILHDHTEYFGEYTFAEGYPNGFCPEALNAGTCRILSELAGTTQKSVGEKTVCRTSVFDLIKTDINSFEVETVVAQEDYRLFRMNFNCGTKGNFIACQKLFESCFESCIENELNKSIEEISESASKNPDILKTVPGFYAIQVSQKSNCQRIYVPEGMESVESENFMDLPSFSALVKKISLFSETAVVSLSPFGEATLNPNFTEMVKAVLSEPGLSVLIETDGIGITEEMCAAIKQIVDSVPERIDGMENNEKIYWIVTLDAFTKLKYGQINGSEENFEKAIDGIKLLAKYFSGSVYPQFTRMNENEDQLESFFRYWNEKSNPSGGKLIVQKYDSFCGVLPDRKPADLSPLERNPCWHIRRDMTVLHDGTVCFCRCQLKNNTIGNAFTEPLEKIWERLNPENASQINGKYQSLCGKCDEYYTFNF